MSRLPAGLAYTLVLSLAAAAPAETGERVATSDLQEVRTAVVALQSVAEARVGLGTLQGEALNLRFQARPGVGIAPRLPRLPQTRQVVTGFRTGREDQPLIVSLLGRNVRESDSLRVIDETGEPRSVTVLAWDPASDLVVLQISGDGEDADEANGDDVAALALADRPATWGSPARVLSQWKPGAPAISAGIVATPSSFDRQLGTEIFQTDALVEPGARGGPVLNDEGKVIGVVAALRGANNGQGPGIAIGLEAVRRLVDFAADGGRGALPKPRLGVELAPSDNGVVVGGTGEGSAAQKAGIQAGDRVVSIDGRQVRQPDDVIGAVIAKRPGEQLKVTVERDGETEQLTVTLDEAPPQEAQAEQRPSVTLYDAPTYILPNDQPLTAEALRERLQQQLLPPQAADLAPRTLPADVGEKLDAITEQLRQLTEQMQQMQERQPAEAENERRQK